MSAFYSDLAAWWPLVSPAPEYAEESEEIARVLRSTGAGVRTVLELGSGGGHVAYHLKKDFTLTLSDLSEAMVARSRELNPECEHLVADMRSLRLGRTFDAVLVHDAIDYMLDEADLAAVFATAFAHLRPGGVALFVPDHTTETFAPGTDCGGTDGPDGEGIRYLEWSHPHDGRVATEYAFVVREANGKLWSTHETHVTGLFPESTWKRLLAAAGFSVEVVVERTLEAREPRRLFLAHRPGGAERVPVPPPAPMRIRRGDLFWLATDEGPAHPHVVVQEDVFNDSRITHVVVCALTSNLGRVTEPGNVLLDVGEGDLPKQSVVVVSQITSVEKAHLRERIGALSTERVDQIVAGLRFQQVSFFRRDA